MENFKSLAHWLPRAALAAVFLFHGITKFMMIPQVAMMLKMSLPGAWALAIFETLAGIFLLLGGFKKSLAWMTRFGALITSIVMIGAVALVHWPQWSFMATDMKPMGGMEFQVTLLAIALYFLVRGNEA